MTGTLTLAIALLVAATVLATAAKRAHVPYNVALVVGGLALALSGLLPRDVTLAPELVFLVCLPALLFEGGITANLGHIRENVVPIALLSTLGMALAVGVTGSAAHLALGLPWAVALVLGALLSVTDTVSILYAFRRANVPPRLAGIMEGESLFNDGTAFVAYGALVSVATGAAVFSPIALTAKALLASAGGLALGLAVGLGVAFVLRRTRDPLAEIMATAAVAFGAYAGAEALHLSGVIACVTAALAVGATVRRELAPESRIALESFWQYAAFGVNTFLFLGIGLSASPARMLDEAPSIGLALLCVFLGRAAAIYVPFALLRLLRPSDAAPPRWQHVFVLGNIKGALSIALALGLPAAIEGRERLVDVTFGVTFVSLCVQGLLLGPALRWLRLVDLDPASERLAEEQGRLIAARAAARELEALSAQGLVPRGAYDLLRGGYQVRAATAERELRRLREQHLAAASRSLLSAQRRLVDAERLAIADAQRGGLLPEATARRLSQDAEQRLLQLERLIEETPGDAPRQEGAT